MFAARVLPRSSALLPRFQKLAYSNPVSGVVVGLRADGKLTEYAKSEKAVVLLGLPEMPRVAVVGLGSDETVSKEAVRRVASQGSRLLKSIGAKVIGLDSSLSHSEAAEGAVLGLHTLLDFKEKKNEEDEEGEAEVQLFPSAESSAWSSGRVKAEAHNLARRLAEMPANKMTPTIVAEIAQSHLSSLSHVEVQIRDREWAAEEQMGLFLSVAQGSLEPLKFVEVHYRHPEAVSAPVVLVGKGVTFDSGGISLKPGSKMDEMRADMTGAASVLSAIWGAARLGLKKHIIALMPLCENMPSGTATKPGDIFVAKNGKTVAVDNTDAEGRLILADTLTYASKFNPSATINVATLTGAMSVALGSEFIGVFANDDDLFKAVHSAGERVGEPIWRMPLAKGYTKMMKHPVADLSNISSFSDGPETFSERQCLYTGGAFGVPGGGACTAAAFLAEFVSGPWMHMDIAGVMKVSKHPYLPPGMGGFPTRTLIDYLENL